MALPPLGRGLGAIGNRSLPFVAGLIMLLFVLVHLRVGFGERGVDVVDGGADDSGAEGGADVGVAVLCILNSMRLLTIKRTI